MSSHFRTGNENIQNNAKLLSSVTASEIPKTSIVTVIPPTNVVGAPLIHSKTSASTPFVVLRTLPSVSGTNPIISVGNVSKDIKITPVVSHSLKVTTSPALLRQLGNSSKSKSVMIPPSSSQAQVEPPTTVKPDPSSSTSSSTVPSNRNVIREMQVRVPNRRDKRFSVLRFHTSDHPDLTSGLEVFMQRENNLKQYRSVHNISETPERGGGTEFGKESREEARFRKHGIVRESYKPDDQPWLMTVGKGKSGRRRFRGVREGNVSDNMEYFVFCQCKDGNFDAYPVQAWYKMKPEINYRFLREDEAEVEYNRLHKTMNLFNVMIKRKLTDGEGEEGATDGTTMDRELGKELRYLSVATESRGNSEKETPSGQPSGSRRSDRALKLTDLDELHSDSDADVEEEEDESMADQTESATTEANKPGTSKQKPLSLPIDSNKNRTERSVKSAAERARLLRKKQRDAAIVTRMRRWVRKRKAKKGRVAGSSSDEDDPLEEAQDESEVDDHEGDEVDYMTNSSSDEEKLSADEREKIYEETGVDDEAALKALLTDVSSEEAEEEAGLEKPAETSATEVPGDSNLVGQKRLDDGLEARDIAVKKYENLLLEDEMALKLHRTKKTKKGDDDGHSSSSSSSSSVDGDSSSYSSSSSDSELDTEEKAKKTSKKAALLQRLTESIHGAPTSGQDVAQESIHADSTEGNKRRLTDSVDSISGSSSKKPRVEEPSGVSVSSSSHPSASGDSELMSTVRKYLMRKPITVTELLKKIRLRKLVGKNEDAQTALANVLRQLRPIKQIINGQHALSLKH